MTRVIRFNTAKFDVSTERPNPINPIPGESLLLWLREIVNPKLAISEPDAEDWGWYAFVEWGGRQYMLGSCASEEENGEREWILQVEKLRSFKGFAEYVMCGRQRVIYSAVPSSLVLFEFIPSVFSMRVVRLVSADLL